MRQRRLLRTFLVKRRTLTAVIIAALGFRIVPSIRTHFIKLQSRPELLGLKHERLAERLDIAKLGLAISFTVELALLAFSLLLVLALAAGTIADAKTLDGRLHANMARRPSVPVVPLPNDGPVTSRNGTQLPPYNTTYYFEQLIDHTKPSLGTFQQRYWTTYEFYETGT